MKALILAAGYATRLYPLTKDYPKPLLKVDRRPIIDYIIDKLKILDDIDEIIVVTNSKFISTFRRWKSGLRINKRITLVDDLTWNHSDRRGAIGDMYFVINKIRIRDDLLVVGGDNLFDGNLSDFLSFAKANKPHPVIGAYNIKDTQKATKYGVIKLNRKSKVIDFKEKPKKTESALVAMCLYYFPKEKIKLIKEYLNPVRNTKSLRSKSKISNGVNTRTNKQDATGFYIDWLRKREPVFGFVFNGRWYDIGHHNFYREAREKFIK